MSYWERLKLQQKSANTFNLLKHEVKLHCILKCHSHLTENIACPSQNNCLIMFMKPINALYGLNVHFLYISYSMRYT